MERQRFDTFTLNFGDAPTAPRETATERPPALANFAMQYAWPVQKPDVPPLPYRDALLPPTQEILTRWVPQTIRLIVEIGAGTGRTTRFLAGLAPPATIIAIDPWEGSPQSGELTEHRPVPSRPHETFLAECWNDRDQIIPVRLDPREGVLRVAEAGLQADLVYVNADRDHDSVANCLSLALDLFPRAILLGNALDQEQVRTALEAISPERGIAYETCGPDWRLVRSTRPAGDDPPAVSIKVKPADFQNL
jgi:hypothetical protein